MSQAQLLAEASEWVVNATFIVSVLFTPVVSVFWPWWRHGIGRTVVAEAVALAIAFFPSTLNLWFGLNVTHLLLFEWIVVICIGSIPLILVWRAIDTWVLQRRGALNGRFHPEQPEHPEQAQP